MWSPEHASKVAAEYLSGLGRRWDHVRTVGKLADELAAAGKISAEVAAAAWLHDLGYAEELSTTGLHALDGAAFLGPRALPRRWLASWHITQAPTSRRRSVG